MEPMPRSPDAADLLEVPSGAAAQDLPSHPPGARVTGLASAKDVTVTSPNDFPKVFIRTKLLREKQNLEQEP